MALNILGGLSRVPAEGGTPQPVTKCRATATHRWPQPLPGSEAILFTLSSSSVAFEDASIATVSLKTGEIKILVHGGYFGRYLPTGDATGHLVYVHEGVLFGVPFDPARLELRGAAVPILEDLAADPSSGAGQFSFSKNRATFVYRTGKVSAQSWPVWWLDHSGKTKPLIATPGFYLEPRFSPDGQRLALAQISGNDRAIFVYDLQREQMSRLTLRQPTCHLSDMEPRRQAHRVSGSPPPAAPVSAGFALTGPGRSSTCWTVRTSWFHTHFFPMAGGWRTSSLTPTAL